MACRRVSLTFRASRPLHVPAPRKSVFKEENFIPGVFNYCNAWCERCFFRLRCRNYAMGADPDGNPIDTSNPQGLQEVEDNLHSAMDLLSEHAEELGFDAAEFEEIDPEEMRAFSEEHEREQEAARDHPLGTLTLAYSDAARNWLDAHEALLDQRLRHLQAQTATHIDGSRLADASEVAHWYVFMIHVKSQRALLGRKDMNEDFWENAVQNDANGSAKVALLGSEESLGAWATIAELMPEHKASILPIIADLYRVVRLLQQTFPDVRNFIRAGFDDGTAP